jgi:ABC-2 type transport system ATP-binding protein
MRRWPFSSPEQPDPIAAAARVEPEVARQATPDEHLVSGVPAVRLLGVGCRLGGQDVIRDVTLDVELGQVTGILGLNGAGKTTLLGIITGLRPLSAGRGWVLGQALPSRGSKLRRRIGVVLQETALYDELTTYQNLDFAAALYNVMNTRVRIYEVLDLLGLVDRANQVAGTLSGGLRRRLTIARALIHEPELLIIDEPTIGVDPEARHAIWAHVRLLQALGTTVIVASNYLDEVQALCDRAAVLRGGRLIVCETPASLIARAGQCIDVQCDAEEVGAVRRLAAGQPSVTRLEPTPSGATLFVAGSAEPEAIVRALMEEARIAGFRVRAADLAEVFRVLEPIEASA